MLLKPRTDSILVTLFACLICCVLVGCPDKSTGDKINETIEEVKDEAGDAVEEVEDEIDDATK